MAWAVYWWEDPGQLIAECVLARSVDEAVAVVRRVLPRAYKVEVYAVRLGRA